MAQEQQSPFLIILFGGLFFIVFVLLVVALLPKQTVVFTDEEDVSQSALVQSYDPVLGDEETADVLIFHYGDFLCEACGDVAASLERIAQDYGDSVAIVWKDFPNVTANPLAPSAALAARCAGKQEAFWPYHDQLFANQRDITEEKASELYAAIAEELDLGIWRFNRCMSKEQTFEDLESSYSDSLDLELTGAPTVRINDEWFTGNISEQELRTAITTLPLDL